MICYVILYDRIERNKSQRRGLEKSSHTNPPSFAPPIFPCFPPQNTGIEHFIPEQNVQFQPNIPFKSRFRFTSQTAPVQPSQPSHVTPIIEEVDNSIGFPPTPQRPFAQAHRATSSAQDATAGEKRVIHSKL